jgi:hypothetical protein
VLAIRFQYSRKVGVARAAMEHLKMVSGHFGMEEKEKAAEEAEGRI